jgi:hypothetical protein
MSIKAERLFYISVLTMSTNSINFINKDEVGRNSHFEKKI